jgi:hypothetical protein
MRKHDYYSVDVLGNNITIFGFNSRKSAIQITVSRIIITVFDDITVKDDKKIISNVIDFSELKYKVSCMMEKLKDIHEVSCLMSELENILTMIIDITAKPDFTYEMLNNIGFSVSPVKSARNNLNC